MLFRGVYLVGELHAALGLLYFFLEVGYGRDCGWDFVLFGHLPGVHFLELYVPYGTVYNEVGGCQYLLVVVEWALLCRASISETPYLRVWPNMGFGQVDDS